MARLADFISGVELDTMMVAPPLPILRPAPCLRPGLRMIYSGGGGLKMVHSELVGGCHKLPAILNYIHTPLSASASYTVPIHVRTVGTKSQMFSTLLLTSPLGRDSSTYGWNVCRSTLPATSVGSSETGSLSMTAGVRDRYLGVF